MNRQRDSPCFTENEAYTNVGNDTLEDLCSGFGNINLQNSVLGEIETTINHLKDEYKSPNVPCKSPTLYTGDSLKGNEIVGDTDDSRFARLNHTGVNSEGSPLGNEVSLPVYLVPSSFPENKGELLVIPVRRSGGCQKERHNLQMKETKETQMKTPDNVTSRDENSFVTCENALVTESNESNEDVGQQESIDSTMESSVEQKDRMSTSYAVSFKELSTSLSSSGKELSSTFTENILPTEETAVTDLNINTPEANGLKKLFASGIIMEGSKNNETEEYLSFIEPTAESTLTSDVSEQCIEERIEEVHIITPANNTPDTDLMISKDRLTFFKESKSERYFQNESVSEVLPDMTFEEDSIKTQKDTILVNSPMASMPLTDKHNATSLLDSSLTSFQSNEAEEVLALNTCISETVFPGKETIQDSTCTDIMQNTEEENLLNKSTLSLLEANKNGVSECDKFVCDTDQIQGSVANVETDMEETTRNIAFTNISSSERVEESQIITTEDMSCESTENNIFLNINVSPKETIIKRDLSVDMRDVSGINTDLNTASMNDSSLCEELNATFSAREIIPDVTFTGIILPNIEEAELLKSLIITTPEANRKTFSGDDDISICRSDGIQGSVSNLETNAKEVPHASFSEVPSSERMEEVKEVTPENMASEKYSLNLFSLDAKIEGDIESEKSVLPKETIIKKVSDVNITNVPVSKDFETSMNNATLCEEQNAKFCGGETVLDSTCSSNKLSDGVEAKPQNPLTIPTSETHSNIKPEYNKISISCSNGDPGSALNSRSPSRAVPNITFTEAYSSEGIKRTPMIPSQNLIFQNNKVSEHADNSSLMEMVSEPTLNDTEVVEPVLDELQRNYPVNILSNEKELNMVFNAQNVGLNSTFSEVITPRRAEKAKNPLETNTFYEYPKNCNSVELTNTAEMKGNYALQKSTEESLLNSTFSANCNAVEDKKVQMNLLDTSCEEKTEFLSSKIFVNADVPKTSGETPPEKKVLQNHDIGECRKSSVVPNCERLENVTQKERNIEMKKPENKIHEIQMNVSPRKSSEGDVLNGTFIKMDILQENIIDDQNSNLNSTFTVNTELSPDRTFLTKSTFFDDAHLIEESSSKIALNSANVVADTSNCSTPVSKLCKKNFEEIAENMRLSAKTSVSEDMEACVLNNFDLQPSNAILPQTAALLPRDDTSLKLIDIQKNAASILQNSTMVQHVNGARRVEENVNYTFNEREQLENVNQDFQKQTFAFDKSAIKANIQADCQQDESFKPNPCSTSSDGNLTSLLPTTFEQPSLRRESHLASGSRLTSETEGNCQASEWNFLLGDEVFQDPSTFDFLTQCGNSKSLRDLRKESLYFKFDPLVGSPRSLPNKEKFVPLLNITTEEKRSECVEVNEAGKVASENLNTESESALVKDIQGRESKSPAMLINVSRNNLVVHMSETEKEEYEKRICALEAEKSELQKTLRKKHELEKAAYTKSLDLEYDIMRLKEENKTLQTEMQKLQEEINIYRLMLPEYERLLNRLVVEKEQTSKLVKELELQKEENLESLKIAEKAYADVCGKYEILASTLKKFKENEEHLLSKLSGYQKAVETQKQNYLTLKNHAANQLQSANEKMLAEQNCHKLECAKLNSAMNQIQLRLKSVLEELEQKAKDNKQLSTMCKAILDRFE